MMKAWNLGGVSRIGSASFDSARYVADYIGKALTGAMAVLYGEREPPFHVFSKGLGRGFVDAYADSLRSREGVTIRGVQVGLPRYYASRLGIEHRRVVDQAPSRIRRVWVGGIPEEVVDLSIPREQREADTEARVRLFKKGKV